MDSKNLVLKAIKLIDEGFEKMNRQIENSHTLDKYLIASTFKAIRLSWAIIHLCDKGLSDEAMPILRSLIEHSINMRWIMESDTVSRLKKYMSDLKNGDFGNKWLSDKSLLDRMNEIGFSNRDYYDFCVKVTYSYAHVNASSLSWHEVYSHPELGVMRMGENSLCVVTAQMLGHIMKALNNKYPGYFDKYESIWQKIPVDKDIRKKIELLKEKLK